MNALILAAHGSRKALSNDEVMNLADKLSDVSKESYPIVAGAFLELAEPSIEDAIANCINLGANKVVVLPYFLNSGRHAAEDIPNIVNAAKQQYPQVEFVVAPHLGSSEKMLDLLVAAAGTALN